MFAKNSLIENIFEKEKSLIVEHDFLRGNSSVFGVFGSRRGFKLTTELSEKVQYPRNQAIKNELNEAILLI